MNQNNKKRERKVNNTLMVWFCILIGWIVHTHGTLDLICAGIPIHQVLIISNLLFLHCTHVFTWRGMWNIKTLTLINLTRFTILISTHEMEGCWLGDPSKVSARVFLEGGQSEKIIEAENEGNSADKLATKLLLCVFTKEEIATGNCTPPRKEGIKLLSPKKV